MFEHLHQAMRAHAVEAYPNEAVGAVIDGEYIRLENVAENPQETFCVDMEAFIAAHGDADVQAIVHSHPDGPNHPSEADMRQAAAWGVPWGIILCDGTGWAGDPFFWGEGVPVPALEGRTFRHGVTDCYALVRDWFKLERGIDLPDLPRTDEWWTKGGNILEEHYAAFGFERIDPKDVQPGDCFLMCIRARNANHSGVFVEDGQILHHLPNRVSRREHYARWGGMLHSVLRYTGAKA
ncbi:C40 family peptidase [Salipiger pacificus]|nr:C40 family peptidase [Alloyangia pacifica]